MQIMRSSNMDLKIIRYASILNCEPSSWNNTLGSAVDSATAIFVDGQTDAGEVPVTTFFDAFPSDNEAYK